MSSSPDLHMLSKAKFSFPLDPKKYASVPVPTFEEYKELWAAWDTVTREMIDEEELLSKPIKLRNCCLFYLGHIPTFLDIHVSRATKSIATKPDYFRDIFERGVDPDVDNPEECHSHSEIPDSWPPASDILAFQERVRQRTAGLYETKAVEANRRLGRALWLGLEHEAMHLETLLYMLLQSEKTLPPPGVRPDFQALADTAQAHAVPNDWVKVPAMKFDVGLEDPENDLGPDRYFGWDNEKPSRCVAVSTFEAKARPITNEEYAQYLERTDKKILPASWVSVSSQKAPLGQAGPSDGRMSNGRFRTDSESGNVTDAFLADKAVRTVYGPVPLKFALDWPMIASYDELRGCAKWMGGRIPTFEETRSIYRYVDYRKREQAENVLGQTISAVNGHLSNNGVEESPPSRSSHFNLSNSKHGPDPSEIFINLENCNVGFKHFHPIPVTQNGSRLSGQAEMGGAWEWTSSVLEKHTGFEAMEVYPGYTADFFDGKHNIVLGGSWATHPRLAGRKTFVNWYQRNYPYAWASARLVRDIVE